MPRDNDMWIFGYGSLMWDPGFAFEECQPALLHGYHRAFCLFSERHRGTPERPGLVLGLAPGGSCKGRAYRVAASSIEAVLDYLHERELVHYVYLFREVPLRLPDACIRAHTYIADIKHERYAGGLSMKTAAAIIREAHGLGGPNIDYLENTIEHLDELGIKEGRLHDLLVMVQGGEAT
ncbi:MAG: gamma-glutamylcyclotransferase [Alphaproteobacteria bacterium]|nr:gamma-glutamylcyclotransferase [Alphaproteobacteria bacterium]